MIIDVCYIHFVQYLAEVLRLVLVQCCAYSVYHVPHWSMIFFFF